MMLFPSVLCRSFSPFFGSSSFPYNTPILPHLLSAQTLRRCLPGNIITPGPHGGASTHRQAAKSTLAGVPRVCPWGRACVHGRWALWVRNGTPGCDGLYPSLVVAIVGVKFPVLRLTSNFRAPQLHRRREWM